jgi:VanZ family protein
MPTVHPAAPIQRAAAKWLLALTIGLILYASFYPFNWQWERLSHADRGGFPSSLPWGATMRSDVVANLLFYIPLGALLLAIRTAQQSAIRALVSTVALGTALSVSVEFLQYAAPPRTPSLTDVLLNAASTALGALAYLWARRGAAIPQLRGRAFDPALLMLLALWAAFHAAPFFPSLRLSQIYRSIQPLLELEFSFGGTARYLAGYLLLSAALRALVKRENFWIAFGVAIGLSLASRVLVVGQSLNPSELLGLALAMPIIVALRDLPHRRAALPVLLLVVCAWYVYALAPFDFINRGAEFRWIPFYGFLENDWGRAYVQFFEKTYLYLGFVWLAVHAGLRVRTAVVLGASIALTIEFVQRYLPGRVAEMTDPVMLALCGLLVAMTPRALTERERGRSVRDGLT